MKRTLIAPLLTLGLLLWGLLALPVKGIAQAPADAATTALRQSQGCYIKLTTARAVGETIDMKLIAENPKLKDITIEGVKEAPQIGNKKVKYTLSSQTIVLRGSIKSFDCGKSQITKVELIQCPTLESFFLGDNQISELDFTACVKLTNFNCYNNQLTELDLTPLKKLKWFNCYGNKLTKLDLTSCPGVSAIRCQDNQLSEIVIPQGSLISAIDCSKNQLTKLDMSHCTKLRSLNCSDNLLTELDLSQSPALDNLVCYNNKIRGKAMTLLIKSLADRSQKSTKGKFKVHFNPTQRPQDGNVCLKSDVALATSKNWTVSYADQELKDPAYEGEEAPLNGSITLTTSHQIGSKIGLIIEAPGAVQIAGVKETPVLGKYQNYTLTSQQVTIQGEITKLQCSSNNLSALQLTDCPTLRTLVCFNNEVTALDLSHAPSLDSLICYINKIESLDFSQTPQLQLIDVQQNQLTSIDLAPLQKLKKINCAKNKLKTLNLTTAKALERLDCFDNQLTQLELPQTATLIWVNCGGNQLSSLDVSACTGLQTLSCYKNQIRKQAMTQLVQALPDRTGMEPAGMFGVHFDETKMDEDGNICLPSDVAIARGKNWLVRAVSSQTDYSGLATGVIMITPSEGVEEISLTIQAVGDVTIEGVIEEPTVGEKATYTLLDKVVTIRGDITSLGCSSSKLQELDLISCPNLTQLSCYSNNLVYLSLYKCLKLTSLSCHTNKIERLELVECSSLSSLDCSSNQIKGEAMTQLMKSLPDRTGLKQGEMILYFSRDEIDFDGNVCYDTDVAIAKAKNWKVGFTMSKDEYEGKESPQAKQATITLTTSRPIGQKISLMIKAEDDFTIEGVDGVPFDGSHIKYTLTSQTITIRGRITQLACWGNDLTAISLENCQDLTVLTCSSNKLTSLDLSHCPKLSLLACARNQIKGEAMKALAESLPDRSNTQPGIWQVHKSLDKIAADGNICLKSDVAIATQRGWRVVLSETNEDYPGADPSASTYTVDLKIGTGGTASITGYSDLKAVPMGTTLTVVASPDEGYKLAQILVNEVDCTESKSFVVKQATIVQVTFQKVDRIEHVTTPALEIYPNPVTDYLLVRGGAGEATILLYDTTGVLVLTDQTDCQGSATLALGSIPSGLYILVVGDQPMSVLVAR